MVTLCDYNATQTRLAALSISNKVAYCRRFGCSVHVETCSLDRSRPIAWSKVCCLRPRGWVDSTSGALTYLRGRCVH